MEEWMIGFSILIVVALLLVAGPILALRALRKLRRMEAALGEWSGGSEPTARLRLLEHRLAILEARFSEPAAAEADGAPGPAAPLPAARPLGPAEPPAAAPGRPAAPLEPAAAQAHEMRGAALRPGVPAGGGQRPPLLAGLDLESLIAGRWLNRIGILLVLIATAFALKYAFDNDWIGPTGRVALGLLAGSGLLVVSQALARRGYTYFSDGMAGLGGGILYLSIYAGWQFYALFSQPVAFTAMIVVTAAMMAIALGRDSQRIALVALAGGFLTPALIGSDRDVQVALFGYLAVLVGALLAAAWLKKWRLLEPPAFVSTQIYFWSWYLRFYDVSEPLARTLAFATLFFVQFLLLSAIRARRTGALHPEQALLSLANSGFYLAALSALLWPERRGSLTLAVLAAGAVYLVLARAGAHPSAAAGRALARVLFAGLALTHVTLAVPIRLDGKWITMAWAVEGAVLVWSGLRYRSGLLRGAGIFLLACAALRVLAMPIPAETLLLNARFATFAVTAACFAAAFLSARAHAGSLDRLERPVGEAFGVGANLLALWALSLEVYDHFAPAGAPGGGNLALDRGLAQQLALSLLWTVCATALIAAGVRLGEAGLRWQALVLYGLVTVKVFTFDLSYLTGGYRIASSIVLGVVLLAVSLLYQKTSAASSTRGAR